MKKCPSCQRTFDDNLRFCQNDGTELIDDTPVDPFKTMVAGQPPVPDDDPLQIPEVDPMKTAMFSAEDQAEVLSTPDPFASLPQPDIEPFSPPPPPDSYQPAPYSPPEYQPIPPPPSFAEPEPYQPPPSPFDSPFGAPPTQQMSPPEWNAPPAPNQQWNRPDVVVVKSQSKGLAVASMICGIASICCCWLGLLLGPAGAIMGWIAKNKIDADPVNYTGRGMAMAGLITGIIGTVIWFGALILQILFGIASTVTNGRF